MKSTSLINLSEVGCYFGLSFCDSFFARVSFNLLSSLLDILLVFVLIGDKLVPGARDVLTDIFKSCIYAEQVLSPVPTKPVKVSDIFLSKEQINSQIPGNLLHVFFTHVRPPKKVLDDQLTQVMSSEQ